MTLSILNNINLKNILLLALAFFSVSEIFTVDVGVGFRGIYIILLSIMFHLFLRNDLALPKLHAYFLIVVVIFLCYLTINALFSYEITRSLIALSYRVIFWFSILLIALYFYAMKFSVESIFNSLIAVLTLSSLYSIAQYLAYYLYGIEFFISIPYQKYDPEPIHLSFHTRVAGFMNGPSEFGIVLACLIPYLLLKWNSSRELIYIVVFVLFSATIALTLSRTAFMAYAMGILLSILNIRNSLRLYLLILLAAPIAFITIYSSPIWEVFIFRFDSNAGYNASSIAGHADYAFAAIAAWLEHPILGVGVGNYESYVQKQVFYDNSPAMTHSAYLEFLAEQGLIGTVANLLIILTFLVMAYKERPVFLGYLVFLISNTTYHVYNFSFSVFFMALCLHSCTINGDRSNAAIDNSKVTAS